MSSDIDMDDVLHVDKKLSHPPALASPPPPSPSSRTSSLSLPHPSLSRNKSAEPTTDPTAPVIVLTDSELDTKESVLKPPNSKPSSSASASASTKPPPPPKPKSKVARPRSPSPSPPPPPPPPLQTIRLEITLGGPDNYEVDVASLAKATGQRQSTPGPVKRDTSDDSEGDDEGDGKPKPKARKKRNAAAEYYDTNDPFIDDSELAVDERQYFAQTKQQGFYVSSGEVALLKDKSPAKKPKSKKTAGAAADSTVAGPSNLKQEGTMESPIALNSDGEEEKVGQKRKRYITVVEGGKKRKIVDVHSFHPDLQTSIEDLKVAIAKESWENKSKFPPDLKPLVAKVALQAIQLDEYDDHFFNLMPVLFPYNRFTMSKLIKRTIFPEHAQIIVEKQDALLEELKAQATAGFEKAQEEWEKSVVVWEKRQEKVKAEAEADPAGAPPPPPPDSAQTRHPTEDPDAGEPEVVGSSSAAKESGKEPHPHPPAKKYRMTEGMKTIVWTLVGLSNEHCRLENEKHTLDGSTLQVSEQGLRKTLYQKIVAAFPEGWMSSSQISRDVSSMKKKLEKEAMEHES